MEQREQRILLVEDEPDTRELLTIVLEHAGYSVIAVEDGHTAHEVLQAKVCNVLVTDDHLPDTRGSALVKQTQTDQPRIATVLISGEPGVEYLAYQCGAHAWFRKGEMFDRLIAAVALACEHTATTNQVFQLPVMAR